MIGRTHQRGPAHRGGKGGAHLKPPGACPHGGIRRGPSAELGGALDCAEWRASGVEDAAARRRCDVFYVGTAAVLAW